MRSANHAAAAKGCMLAPLGHAHIVIDVDSAHHFSDDGSPSFNPGCPLADGRCRRKTPGVRNIRAAAENWFRCRRSKATSHRNSIIGGSRFIVLVVSTRTRSWTDRATRQRTSTNPGRRPCTWKPSQPTAGLPACGLLFPKLPFLTRKFLVSRLGLFAALLALWRAPCAPCFKE